MVMLISMSTVTTTSQITIITKIGSAIIRSREVRVAGSNGSTTPKTEKELLTGIRELRRNTTGEQGAMLRSPGRPTAAVRSREGRTSLKEGPNSSKVSRARDNLVAIDPAANRAVTPSAAWTGAAARRVITAAGAVPVGRACHPAVVVEVAVSAAAVDHVAAVEVVPVVVVAAEEEAADSCPC